MKAKSSKLEFSRSSTKMVTGAFPSGLSSPASALIVWVWGASKEKIDCGLLSSVMVKSSLASPLTTGRPFLSSTVTSRKTRRDVTWIVGVSEVLVDLEQLNPGRKPLPTGQPRRVALEGVSWPTLARSLLLLAADYPAWIYRPIRLTRISFPLTFDKRVIKSLVKQICGGGPVTGRAPEVSS